MHSGRRSIYCAALAILSVALGDRAGLARDDDSVPRPAAPDPASVASLRVEPAEVLLHGASRQQQLLVSAVLADGREVDVTRDVRIVAEDPAVCRSGGATLLGLADGTTAATVSYGSHAVRVPVRVAEFAVYPPVHFANDIEPLLSKLGCNSGGCHGRAQGQNGFKLSVFGFDPKADYDAIVKEGRGRRIFPASPRDSLILAKPTARIAHGGGQRLKDGSPDYELLLRWLEQGMPRGSDTAPQLVGLTVAPRERVLAPGGEQQILATAHYSDGSRRDVSSAAQYASNAARIAEVGSQGLVQCGGNPGEAAITVNYMGQVAAVQVFVPRPPRSDGAAPLDNERSFDLRNDDVVAHRIDELVAAKLHKMGLASSELCDDATFLRRLFLDVIGTLPSAAEVREFLADASADKRSRWIDRVLDRPEYADYWALKWADVLLIDKEKLGDRGAYEFHRWLRDQFATNRPYDAWVRDLITATGNSGRNGPVNLYRAADTPEALARTVGQAFLGVRIECAQCHHHPFERWSQEDFYGLAGYFNGMERKPLPPDRVLVYHAGYRPTLIPLTNQPVDAHPLGVAAKGPLPPGDPRGALADWITAPDNPWFARLLVNRAWKRLLGRGLVEPEDDLRSTNPATNEPLLEWLAQQAVASRFDHKALLRHILNSRTYQRSSAPTFDNRDDEQNFSHYYVRRMPAEVMLDAIGAATGVAEEFPGQPHGTRALSLWDNRLPSYFLEIFGRPPRSTPCECGRSSEPTMAQALHLMNAPEVEQKIAAPHGTVARLLAGRGETSERLSAVEEAALVEELTLIALGRPPRDKERRAAQELFGSSSPRQAAEDFLWTLLNSYDFLFVQ